MMDMVVRECKVIEDLDEEECAKGDTTVAWLSALGAAIIVSLLSLVGAALLPLDKGKTLTYVMPVLLSFAVGALLGDAVLHLIPVSLGVHSHGHEEEEHDDEDDKAFLGPASMVLLGAFIFFIFEREIEHIHHHVHKHSHGPHVHKVIFFFI
jgi:zinc transporter ZupT